MSINPDNITTIRVDQLATATLNLTNEFPHSEDVTLKKATIQDLVDLVANAVESLGGASYLPISVTDGQQLPDLPENPSFFLCGKGTFLNVNGFASLVCTKELNVIMSLTDRWSIAVEIPVVPDLQSIGISQSVNDGVIDKAPSENAVYDFIAQWLPKASLGYFDYADLATQTTPISVTANVQTLLTNDTLGTDTNTSQPPYGVSAIWDADSDEFNFSQLSIGDTVDIRVHLKTTTTSANQKYHVDMKFAFDGPSEFENRIFSQYVKTISEDEQTFITTLYIGSSDVRDYPAKLYITSDDDATVKVVGWFCRVFRKSVNIVDIVVAEEAPIDGLTYGRKNAEWVEVSGGGGSVPDATTTVKGKIKLAGDLAGTADLPTVPNKVDKNTAITGATKTKITYDSKGLVTAGADATTADIDDITTRRYVTDTQISTWNAMIGGSIFQSVWNASTNSPNLSSGVGTKGYYYIVNIDGTTNLDGINDWKIGDWAIFDGTVWRKVDNTDAISSFNGRTGAITLLDTDVTSALGFTPISNLSPSLSGLVTVTGTTQTGSSGTGTLSLSQTWNTTGSPTAIILNVTNTASGAAARLLDLQTGGVSRFAVDKLGGMSATLITSTAEINAGLANAFTWGTSNSRATIYSPSNGIIRLSNATGTDFTRLQFGLTNNTAPSIKRNGTALNFRLADDSADCPITASNGTFSGNIIANGTTSVVRLKGYTVATLPSGTQGDNAFVTDALAPTILNTVVGGGTVVVRVFYNGTNWIVQ